MKKLLLLAGVVTIAITFAFSYIVSPPPLPLLDANRQVLAESVVEGYCSGVYLITRSPVVACWEEEADRGTHRNLSQVVTGFCFGIVEAGWDGTTYDCQQIMADNLYWPLLSGGITNSWSARYAYPLDRFAENIKPDESRTGVREGESR